MPRRCSVCDDPKRKDVDRALVTRTEPIRGIARKFGLSEDALYRHADTHVPGTLARAADAKEATRADDLLAEVRSLWRRALAILDTAESAGDLKTALGAIREARGNLELFGRLAGELRGEAGATVNVLISPEWRATQAAILAALAPYPSARIAVAAVLASGGSAPPNGNGHSAPEDASYVIARN